MFTTAILPRCRKRNTALLQRCRVQFAAILPLLASIRSVSTCCWLLGGSSPTVWFSGSVVVTFSTSRRYSLFIDYTPDNRGHTPCRGAGRRKCPGTASDRMCSWCIHKPVRDIYSLCDTSICVQQLLNTPNDQALRTNKACNHGVLQHAPQPGTRVPGICSG